MGRTDCTEPQCLYKDELYLFLPTHIRHFKKQCYMNGPIVSGSCRVCHGQSRVFHRSTPPIDKRPNTGHCMFSSNPTSRFPRAHLPWLNNLCTSNTKCPEQSSLSSPSCGVPCFELSRVSACGPQTSRARRDPICDRQDYFWLFIIT